MSSTRLVTAELAKLLPVCVQLTTSLKVEFLLKIDSGYPNLLTRNLEKSKDFYISKRLLAPGTFFLGGFESTQLARQLLQERKQMEVQ